MDKIELEKKLEKGMQQPPEMVAEFEVGEEEISQREVKQGTEKLPLEIERDLAPASVGAPGIDTTDSPLHQNVEAILEDDLEELYFSMNEQQQEKFKKKGEQTAARIVKLIKAGKATFRKIFRLILSWLKFIPGVNKYFLEQEAKIKADRIINIKGIEE